MQICKHKFFGLLNGRGGCHNRRCKFMHQKVSYNTFVASIAHFFMVDIELDTPPIDLAHQEYNEGGPNLKYYLFLAGIVNVSYEQRYNYLMRYIVENVMKPKDHVAIQCLRMRTNVCSVCGKSLTPHTDDHKFVPKSYGIVADTDFVQTPAGIINSFALNGVLISPKLDKVIYQDGTVVDVELQRSYVHALLSYPASEAEIKIIRSVFDLFKDNVPELKRSVGVGNELRSAVFEFASQSSILDDIEVLDVVFHNSRTNLVQFMERARYRVMAGKRNEFSLGFHGSGHIETMDIIRGGGLEKEHSNDTGNRLYAGSGIYCSKSLSYGTRLGYNKKNIDGSFSALIVLVNQGQKFCTTSKYMKFTQYLNDNRASYPRGGYTSIELHDELAMNMVIKNNNDTLALATITYRLCDA
jgi:hypothetical protein